MANTKEIQKRMKSIKDTMKITSAMYMISSSKLRTAKKKLEEAEPYFFTLQSVIARLLRHIPEVHSIFFEQNTSIPEEEKRRGFIVITADKGLAGAYNHNAIKKTHELLKKGKNNKVFAVGEAGRQFFLKENLEVDKHFMYTVQKPTLHRARVLEDYVLDLYQNNELDEVYIVYTRMENAFSMITETKRLLPMKQEDFVVKQIPADTYQEEIRLAAPAEYIMDRVITSYVNGFIYGALVESYCSEQNSRMMAMESATASAKDMLFTLKKEYNQLRQAAITQEITEVIGGAKAKKRKQKK
ncbi:ATP synthase F1 subunit gamma [[Clostridium] polysaccharolyticum]|uniref:ATP synthase gamma chain n=1 Tax=[Clostridium] polysaccharolyticum TaxID=29364 RepID=A0A1H9ZYQ5_9FIRM|nr:ATP synthase F1 subunit gamma [[Clostridium] polysaccharolyticum]SES86510.1 F-type H+-transporting ATPase subunit gamma [[Clostridium] polysaccharolyticum]